MGGHCSAEMFGSRAVLLFYFYSDSSPVRPDANQRRLKTCRLQETDRILSHAKVKNLTIDCFITNGECASVRHQVQCLPS